MLTITLLENLENYSKCFNVKIKIIKCYIIIVNEKYGKCTDKTCIGLHFLPVSPRISLRKFDYVVDTEKKSFF